MTEQVLCCRYGFSRSGQHPTSPSVPATLKDWCIRCKHTYLIRKNKVLPSYSPEIKCYCVRLPLKLLFEESIYIRDLPRRDLPFPIKKLAKTSQNGVYHHSIFLYFYTGENFKKIQTKLAKLQIINVNENVS